MRKLTALLLALTLLLSLAATAQGQTLGNGGTMYVYTENGKGLNVRSSPVIADNQIGAVPYGGSVYVIAFEGSWAMIEWGDSTAWVMSRFLQWYKPGPKPQPTPRPTQDPEKAAEKAELESEISVAPYEAIARASRSSGWVNLRKGPSKATQRVERYTDGTPLQVIGETTNWYRILNPANGKTGYIRKDFIIAAPQPQPQTPETASLGKLTINGAFSLQCRMPEGYTLQVISSSGSRVIASLMTEDPQKPQMLLTVSYDEMYADTERLNDLSKEEIDALKGTFSDMNAVSFEEKETTHGTKLLIVKETGDDADFVDIFSIYQGYCIEFVLSPKADAQNQTLTDAQVQMCIDFLSDLDFVPVN